MKHILAILILSSITIISCTKDDDSYAYGEKPKPSPSYEIIEN